MNKVPVFTKENTVIVVVDIQDKLAVTMKDKDQVIKNVKKVLKTAEVLNIPILFTEQYPQGLGKTVEELIEFTSGKQVEKVEFSCGRNDDFVSLLKSKKKDHIILTGMEAHICVMQTANDLINEGYTIGVISDAVSSFKEVDKIAALQRLSSSGAVILTAEMLVYELIKKAGTKEFKVLLPQLKER